MTVAIPGGAFVTNKPRGKTLAVLVVDALRGTDGHTADEIADRINVSALSVRPRVAILNSEGAIVDTGARRTNASGRLAKVWRLA